MPSRRIQSRRVYRRASLALLDCRRAIEYRVEFGGGKLRGVILQVVLHHDIFRKERAAPGRIGPSRGADKSLGHQSGAVYRNPCRGNNVAALCSLRRRARRQVALIVAPAHQRP